MKSGRRPRWDAHAVATMFAAEAFRWSKRSIPWAAPPATSSSPSRATQQIQRDVAAGSALTMSMTTTGVFPTMVLQMSAIGEESGALDDMLARCAEFYEEEVDCEDGSRASLTLMEPIIIVVLGTLIGPASSSRCISRSSSSARSGSLKRDPGLRVTGPAAGMHGTGIAWPCRLGMPATPRRRSWRRSASSGPRCDSLAGRRIELLSPGPIGYIRCHPTRDGRCTRMPSFAVPRRCACACSAHWRSHGATPALPPARRPHSKRRLPARSPRHPPRTRRPCWWSIAKSRPFARVSWVWGRPSARAARAEESRKCSRTMEAPAR